MANYKKRRSENIESELFVDSTCIDCGTCYWISPQVYKRVNGQSAVISAPSDQNTANSMRALLSCPTNSIGWQGDKDLIKDSRQSLPYQMDDNVYHTGFHSEKSFGATAYFIKDDEHGNFLVDSPRYTKDLVNSFESMGGVKNYYLSHKDDVADVDKYYDAFNAPRSIHTDDVNAKSSHYENKWEGTEAIQINKDLICIPVPGHTKGSVVYLYKDKFLFTGDHLAYSRNLGHLYAFRTACWYDFDVQIESMKKLLQYDFEWVLPGHGSPINLSKDEMKKSLEKCIHWMENP